MLEFTVDTYDPNAHKHSSIIERLTETRAELQEELEYHVGLGQQNAAAAVAVLQAIANSTMSETHQGQWEDLRRTHREFLEGLANRCGRLLVGEGGGAGLLLTTRHHRAVGGGGGPTPPSPFNRLGHGFLRAFGRSKFFSGAFGANWFRPKIFFRAFGASKISAPRGRDWDQCHALSFD